MLRFATLILLAAAFVQGETDPALWHFVHPNAQALISIDWRHIRQTHVGTMLREKWIDNGPGANIPGVEFLNDVDRVVISSAERNPGDGGEPPVLIVIRGHFDLAKTRRLLVTHGAKPQMFNSTQVYRPQSKTGKDMAFVLMDAETILIGDSRSIFSVLERNVFQSSAQSANSILSRAAELDSAYEFWAIMTATSSMANDRLMSFFTGGEPATQARGFEFGVSLKNGLLAENTVMLPSEAAAKNMASELSKLIKAAIKEKIGEPAMVDLEKKMKMSAEGTLVRMRVRLTPQELDKNAQIFAASRKQNAGSLAGVQPMLKSVPAKPEKSVIRIEGLDEGPREIPYKPERPLP